MDEAKAIGLRVDYYERGRILGVRYEIPGEGWGLPLHAHSARSDYHNVIALSGEVIVFGERWFKVLCPGEVFDTFDNGLSHAITSNGPASWLNLFLYEPSDAIRSLRDDEKHTTLNSRVDLPDWLLGSKFQQSGR